jgi:hypothetical protein
MESPDRALFFQPPLEGRGELAAVLRPYLDRLAREAVDEIQGALPEYVRPDDTKYAEILELSVQVAMRHYVDLLADPETPWDDVLEFFHDVGYGEAKEGRNLDIWHSSLRLGARVAVRWLAEESVTLGISTRTLGQLAESVFAFLDTIASAAARGHAEATARATGELERRRRRLVDLLTAEPAASPQAIEELAQAAEWPMPRLLAAVVLRERGDHGFRRPALPPEVLVDLDRPEPCLIVPDPDGPGRRRLLADGLRGWNAALGPAVGSGGIAKSLRWARETLALARRGILPGEGLLAAVDHMPTLIIMRQEELVGAVAAARLAPLAKGQPGQRRRLARTLQACFESGFNATEVAERLGVHAQTVRYRLRQLEELFGPDLYDPSRRLEFEIVLLAWLATAPAEDGQDETPPVEPLTPASRAAGAGPRRARRGSPPRA